MPRIKILPEIIANQIAAGEVVERPATVVKELVENSIDSGASRIVVKFSHGGKYSITVEDNGCGMNMDDAMLAFERHATSKIEKFDDINSIDTFGFRGEAIPSIASVSKFTMLTREKSEKPGNEILFNAGKFIHSKECGIAPGTTIHVDQLFHNVPARRLFLKTDQTEAENIIAVIKNFALVERDIYFELHSDFKKIFQSPEEYDWPKRVGKIFFQNEHLIAISHSKNNISIEGCIGDPASGMPCKKFFSFFVNRRPIDSKLLRFFTQNALVNILPKYREIIACLIITIDPKFIDVNVHPTKREIRFRNEQFIKECVTEAISSACKLDIVEPTEHILGASTKLCAPAHIQSSKIEQSRETSFHNMKDKPMQPKVYWEIFHETRNFLEQNDNQQPWRFIGHIFNNCALFESESGMIIFNIKLATRKILFEQLISNSQKSDSQALLFPVEILTNDEESQILETLIPLFTKKQIEIYQFGKNHYRISVAPSWLSNGEAEKFVHDMIRASIDYDFTNKIDAFDSQFAKLASQCAKCEQYTSEAEINDLVIKLLGCNKCSLCPNGNSTFFEVPKCDFLKRFSML